MPPSVFYEVEPRRLFSDQYCHRSAVAQQLLQMLPLLAKAQSDICVVVFCACFCSPMKIRKCLITQYIFWSHSPWKVGGISLKCTGPVIVIQNLPCSLHRLMWRSVVRPCDWRHLSATDYCKCSQKIYSEPRLKFLISSKRKKSLIKMNIKKITQNNIY